MKLSPEGRREAVEAAGEAAGRGPDAELNALRESIPADPTIESARELRKSAFEAKDSFDGKSGASLRRNLENILKDTEAVDEAKGAIEKELGKQGICFSFIDFQESSGRIRTATIYFAVLPGGVEIKSTLLGKYMGAAASGLPQELSRLRYADETARVAQVYAATAESEGGPVKEEQSPQIVEEVMPGKEISPYTPGEFYVGLRIFVGEGEAKKTYQIQTIEPRSNGDMITAVEVGGSGDKVRLLRIPGGEIRFLREA